MRYTLSKYSQDRKFQDFFKEEVKQNTSNLFLFTRTTFFTEQCCKDNFLTKFFCISYLAHSIDFNNCSFTNLIQRMIVPKAQSSASMAFRNGHLPILCLTYYSTVLLSKNLDRKLRSKCSSQKQLKLRYKLGRKQHRIP